jgi:hypothetical protein
VKVKKAITIEKEKESVQKYESGIHVTDLADMYSMSKSTISTITHIMQPFFIMKRLGKECFWSFGTRYVYSIISYGKNRIEFLSQGSSVFFLSLLV